MISNSVVHLIAPTWAEFVKYLDGTHKALKLQSHRVATGYELFCLDGEILYEYFIWDRGTSTPGNDVELDDFLDNWSAQANQPIAKEVVVKQWALIPSHLARTVDEGYVMNIVAGVNPTIKTISFDYNVDFYGGSAITSIDSAIGDYLIAHASPLNDEPVGTITADAVTGATSVTITSPMLSWMKGGCLLRFGTDAHNYRIRTIDITTGAATLMEPLLVDYVTGSAVRFSFPYAYKKWIAPNCNCTLDSNIFEPMGMPPTMQFILEYHHKTTPATNKELLFNLHYRY